MEKTWTVETDARGVEYTWANVELESLPRGWARCGTCGIAWNDEKSTSVTPAPSARCPFEYDHKEEPVVTRHARYVPAPPDLEDVESLRVGMPVTGDTVLIVSKPSVRYAGGHVVLALATNGAYEPYVTWIAGVTPGQPEHRDPVHLECSWGHYFTSLGDALVDFAERD